MKLYGYSGEIMNNQSRMGLSDRYILFIALAFSTLILTTAFFYYRFSSRNMEELENGISRMTSQVQDEKTRLVMERISPEERKTVPLLTEALKRECTRTGGFLHVIIFSHTTDDNFFRVLETIQLSALQLNLPSKGAIVQEEGNGRYGQNPAASLRRGLTGTVLESTTYGDGATRWQNLYFPVTIGSTPGVIQFILSADIASSTEDRFRENLRSSVISLSVLSIVLVIIVAAGSLVFSHNYTLLIRNLSRSLMEAGGGNLGINLRPVQDEELDELAHSFNTLIEGLREREYREKELEQKLSEARNEPKNAAEENDKTAAAEKIDGDESLDMIFRIGVQAMKDNDLDSAISLFRTLTILKPDGFGSHFNLGVAYAKKADYDSSLKMFTRAREINPDYELTERYIEKVTTLKNRNG